MEAPCILGRHEGKLVTCTSAGSVQRLRLTGDDQALGRGNDYYYPVGYFGCITFSEDSSSAFFISYFQDPALLIQLQSSVETRIRPGVIFSNSDFYLFGGFADTDLILKSSVEKLHISRDITELATAEWCQLRPMLYERASFLPCMYANLMYLCGGFTQYCEKYDSVTETTKALPFTLREFEWKSHLTVFVDQEIVILSERWVTMYIEAKQETVSYEIDKVPDPYSSGGVSLTLDPPNHTYTLHYVHKGEFVVLTLPTSV